MSAQDTNNQTQGLPTLQPTTRPRLTIPRHPTAVEVQLYETTLPEEIKRMVKNNEVEQIHYYAQTENCQPFYVLNLRCDPKEIVYEFFYTNEPLTIDSV